ncbi:leucine-rich repeat domain-containing protein [Prevotella pallens]|uniref:leucine-rich repeat domain-containing protein n=3 Tax=Prevotella TaxID=838 RepID=UPI0023EF5ADA|nr:leucine-rich repeat domain-containing protein [Prevotella pallens]
MKQIYILLIALLMGLSANAEESGTCGPHLRWHFTDNGVLTISGKGKMYDYSFYNRAPWGKYNIKRIIKRIIIGDGITTIGSRAFYTCSALISVTIPNSVTTIGEGAFVDCRLTSVTIPNSVTEIGDRAFEGCSALTSVTIPNSVTKISDLAFARCSALTSVNIPNSVTKISDLAFNWCERLTSISIPNSVTEIGSSAFEDCRSLTSVTIPNSVTKISASAFSLCVSLASVTIPNSVKNIGILAFFKCTSITQISSEAVVPPICESNVFDDINKSECKLIVPKNSLDAYKQADQWKDFLLIEGSTTGITNTVYNNSGLADVNTIGNKTAK